MYIPLMLRRVVFEKVVSWTLAAFVADPTAYMLMVLGTLGWMNAPTSVHPAG